MGNGPPRIITANDQRPGFNGALGRKVLKLDITKMYSDFRLKASSSDQFQFFTFLDENARNTSYDEQGHRLYLCRYPPHHCAEDNVISIIHRY